MDVDQLIAAAESLQQPGPTSASEYEQRRERMAAELNRRMLARADLAGLVGGEDNREMMRNNSHNMARFMGTMFGGFDAGAFVRTVVWVFRAYRSHGFSSLYWAANLDTFVDVARTELSESAFAEIGPFFEWLIVHIPQFVAVTDEELSSQALDTEPAHG
jgi:hypothetical protein